MKYPLGKHPNILMPYKIIPGMGSEPIHDRLYLDDSSLQIQSGVVSRLRVNNDVTPCEIPDSSLFWMYITMRTVLSLNGKNMLHGGLGRGCRSKLECASDFAVYWVLSAAGVYDGR